jgi:hypothetical protein
MDRFVRSQNVERYRRLIASVTENESVASQVRRETIIALLTEDQQKQNKPVIQFNRLDSGTASLTNCGGSRLCAARIY